ncbi:MAG: UDP-N-acetylmuramoyl-tripeptide--D-alanyl-D-alanine ligase [Micrococcales bacterium]
MIRLQLSEIASAVDGQLVGADIVVKGSVETDSRLVGAGSLFVAKPGEFADGHDFVASAITNGAVAAIVERPVDVSIPQVVVADAVLALGKLASFVLARLREGGRLKVVGVTGSNGKTSTKNMLRAVLSQFGTTIAPIESYNNEVGAPFSMLLADESTDFLVVELGAGGPGSIRYLTEICRPDISVMLKVGLAHVGEFGGIEKTFEIKSELIQAAPEAGFVFNADDEYIHRMAPLTQGEITWFGTDESAAVRADDILVNLAGTSFELSIGDYHRKVTLQILGEHQVMNALATIAVVARLGLHGFDKVVEALEAMPLAERWRMQRLAGPNGSIVINDAYNASPDSTRAALQTLATIGRQGHRTVAVLGEMAELGAFSAEQHDYIGRTAVRLNIDQVVVVGAGAKLIHMGATQEGSWDGESKYFDSASEAVDYLRGLLGSGDVVLVKSSKSAELRFLGDALAEVES